MEINESTEEKLEFGFRTVHGAWKCTATDFEQTSDRRVAEGLECQHQQNPDRTMEITNADIVQLTDKEASVENRGNNTTVVDSRNIDDVDTSNKFRDGITARFE